MGAGSAMTPGEDRPPQAAKPARVIAFHLPQFHPIPENDEWWGRGFTEWTNVSKARPRYPGHYQPHLPADLGFYDLRLPEARMAQAELARSYGLEGFLYWHYWFGDGRRILERPVDEIIASGEPRFPFALAWANESWTGIWHGAGDRILVEQRYPGPADDRAHFASLLPAFRDPRYIRVNGRPLFYVFHPEQLPNAAEFVETWQRMAQDAGLRGLYLLAEASDLLGRGIAYQHPKAAGFDGCVYLRLPAETSRGDLLAMRIARRAGVAEVFRYRSRPLPLPRSDQLGRVYPGIYPNWDNTARSGARGLVLHGSSPDRFRPHVREALHQVALLPHDERLVFVKSWNEWAEGNHLEPDRRFGLGYLETISEELAAATKPDGSGNRMHDDA